MLKIAEHIFETKESNFEWLGFVDHYEEAVVAMLKNKQAGLPTPKDRPSVPAANVVNLMDALRRSISQETASAPKPQEARRRSS